MRSARSALYAAVTALTLGFLFVGVNAQESPKGASDYWPFKEGNTWTLLAKVGEKEVSLIITVAKVTTNGGKTEAQLEYKVNEKIVRTEIYQVDARSLVRVASGQNASDKINPPFPVMLFPLTDGKKWEWKGTIQTKGKPARVVSTQTASGPETLKLDAGTFQAMHIHMDQTVTVEEKQQRFVNDYWFAPKVGIVQQKTNVNGQAIAYTVTSYKLKE